MPALHWLFRPASLVGAANRAIKAWDLHGVGAQPAPLRSWDGRRNVLPTLNGLTGMQFEELAQRRFAHMEVRYELIGRVSETQSDSGRGRTDAFTARSAWRVLEGPLHPLDRGEAVQETLIAGEHPARAGRVAGLIREWSTAMRAC